MTQTKQSERPERKQQSSKTQRQRRGKDISENRNNRTAEDQSFFVPSDGSVPERYRF